MAKLSKEEMTLMERLKAKMEAPEAPSIGRQVIAHVNLGNADEVSLAKKLGFFPDDDDDDDDDDGDGEEETPRRGGFFGDK